MRQLVDPIPIEITVKRLHVAMSTEAHERLLEGLFRSNSWLAVVMISDLLGTTQRFNVPGAVSDTTRSVPTEF